jgi:hypothetical protein
VKAQAKADRKKHDAAQDAQVAQAKADKEKVEAQNDANKKAADAKVDRLGIDEHAYPYNRSYMCSYMYARSPTAEATDAGRAKHSPAKFSTRRKDVPAACHVR